jgi:hypothetical protein
MKSEKYTMIGYSPVTWWNENKLWFVRNKETIKSLVAALLGVLATRFGNNWLIAILFGAGGAYVTKLILDAVDYFLSE